MASQLLCFTGFGFCEYGDPESTLRALRILHDFKLGEKNLVVKVDSKTRTDLLKYVLKKRHKKDEETVDEQEVRRSCTGYSLGGGVPRLDLPSSSVVEFVVCSRLRVQIEKG